MPLIDSTPCPKPLQQKPPLRVGALVQIIGNTDHHHAFPLGVLGIVVAIREYGIALVNNTDASYLVMFDDLQEVDE